MWIVRGLGFLAIAGIFAGCPQAERAAAPDAAAARVPSAADAAPSQRADEGTLAGSSSVAASAPRTIADEMEIARAKLEQWVRPGASDPAVGWALGHGLLAFGKDLETTDGRKAIDVIASSAQLVEIGGKKRLDFPQKTATGVLDAHDDLAVKSMLEAGVPRDRVFDIPGVGKVKFQRLLDDAFATVTLPQNDKEWHDFAWSLSAMLAAHADRARPKGKPDAVQRKLIELSLATLAYVEGQQAFLAQLMEENAPQKVEKRKQQIFSHTCGGLHLVQAAVASAAFIGTPEARARARTQLDVLLFRWQAERRIYAETVAKAPQYALLIRTQELKFYGHLLETFALAAQAGVVEKGEPLRSKLAPIAADLVRTVGQLAPAYANLANVRRDREQTYLDLIGDGCHAIRGLRESLVAFFRP